MGTNVLVGQDMERLLAGARRILSGDARVDHVPALWDGRAGLRIADLVTPASPNQQSQLEEPLVLQQ
jgi:hypothetical protein